MDQVIAVLVIPASGDPGGLTARGRCGAVNPCVWRFDTDWTGDEDNDSWGINPDELALPLWWDGALVPEGWDRARRVWWTIHERESWWIGSAGPPYPELTQVLFLAASLTRSGDPPRASRVVRLARVDGRLVEVEP